MKTPAAMPEAAVILERCSAMGLRQFEEGSWLYPGEWYEHIPEGCEVESILGETKAFEKGTTDDDTRLGCLPYGFKRTPR